MHQPSYAEHDYQFGQLILRLRTAIGLTQTALAEVLGVSRRAIIKWEDGSNYPKAPHLKEFIALAYKRQCFQAGHEVEEIRSLWYASHQKNLLDEIWLAKLLAPASSQVINLAAGEPKSLEGELLHNVYPPKESGPRFDWDDAQTVPNFYGRELELHLLIGWLRNERCRVVSLLGMGGIGKTVLAVTLMHQLSNDFEVVIWRSLRDAGKCEDLLDEFFQVLAPQDLDKEFPHLERRITRLLEHLRSRRVLLVLDNLESLLIEGEGAGKMRPGYEGYSQLLRRIAEFSHQSSLILTSREKPADLVAFEGNRAFVRSLHLARLSLEACEQLLADKEIKGTTTEQANLIESYNGNPLALKIVAQTILEVFDGEIALFLAQGEVIFGEIREILDGQFQRLSKLEQSLMLWLAIMRESTTFEELAAVLVNSVSRARLLEAVEALRRRSLIERGQRAGSYTLQSVVLEYATKLLITEIAGEIQEGKLVRLLEHNLVQARAKDYIRQSQERLLIAPLVKAFQADSGVGKVALLARLINYFDELRTLDEATQGYGPANIISMVRLLKGDLTGLDLARLVLRDVYLQGVQMQNTNLAGAIIRDSVFSDSIGSIYSMAITESGEYWVLTTVKCEVVIWKAATHTLYRTWQFRSDSASSRCALSPDGQRIVIGSQVGGIKLWNLESGHLIRVLLADVSTGFNYDLAYSPDGKKIAATTAGETVRIWDEKTGLELETLNHPDDLPVVKWRPDGHMIASGDVKGVIYLWEIPETGAARCIKTLIGHTRQVVGLAFAPDGQTLASASWDGTVKTWDVRTGQEQQTLTGHKDRVSRIAWSQDGRTIASGGRDSDPSIWLWDVEQSQYRAVFLGHTGMIRGLAFTPDSNNLLSASADGEVRLWDVSKGQCIRVLENNWYNPFFFEWSPDSTHIVSSNTDATITIYDLNGNRSPQFLRDNLELISMVSWSPDGRWITGSDKNNTLRLWNAQTGESLHLFQQSEQSSFNFFPNHWSPDGRWLASGTENSGIVLWDVIERRPRWEAKPFPDTIMMFDWHPGGTLIAGNGSKGYLYIWDGNDGTIHQQINHKLNLFHFNPTWSPDGTRLAVTLRGENGITIQIYDTQNWETLPVTFRGAEFGAVFTLCWDRRGEILISGNDEGYLSWWDVESGECIRTIEAHKQGLNWLRKSPEGSRFASSGNDGNIKIWDIKSGELLQTIRRVQPYERLNITGVRGLTEAQKNTLYILGAVAVDDNLQVETVNRFV